MVKSIAKTLKEQMVLPVIAAPMFLVSTPDSVINGCKSGIIGSITALNARTTEDLDEWMKRITNEISDYKKKYPEKRVADWAINLIVHRSNKRLAADLELVKKYEPPIVITSLGNPSKVVEAVHGYGGLVFSDVSNVYFAQKVAEQNVDGLILVCGGAGGHAGTLNPMAFMAAVKEFWKGTTVLAGAISTGQDILASQVLGADFAYLGTRFIPVKESMASDEYKQMLIDSNIEDIIYTDGISGVKANFLIPSIEKAGLDPNNLMKRETIDISHKNRPKAWKNIWSAGQGVTTIKDIQSTENVVSDLVEEYKIAQGNLQQLTTH